MELKNLRCDRQDSIALLTLTRPSKLNALNRETLSELAHTLDDIRDDPEVRVVIITGEGEKAFCAGADIEEFIGLSPVDSVGLSRQFHGVMDRIEGLGKPVIAAVNGLALGGGCELALSCSFRIASTNAKFGLPELALGVIPGAGGTQRLPRLIGKGRALEMILTGAMIDAEEAYRVGLANRVVPPEALVETCRGLAKKICQKAPVAVQLAMKSVQSGLEVPLDQGLLLESHLAGLCSSTEDQQEGVRAFQEKRAPRFKGR